MSLLVVRARSGSSQVRLADLGLASPTDQINVDQTLERRPEDGIERPLGRTRSVTTDVQCKPLSRAGVTHESDSELI